MQLLNLKNLKVALMILAILSIFIYVFWRSSDYFFGPHITVISPVDGQSVEIPTFDIVGKVTNAKEIKLNGREINIDEKGNFKETLISHSPITLINIYAEDKYGKSKEKVLRVVYQK